MANEKKIDYLLLGVLSHESMTGYEIKKRLDTRLKFFWNASYGSIYPALANLQESGYVQCEKADGGRGKIVYTITQSGRKFLKCWLSAPVIKDELRYETLLKLFFGAEADEKTNIAHIGRFEEKIQKELPFLKQSVDFLSKDLTDDSHKYYMLTALFGVKAYECFLEWCKQAKEILGDGEQNV